MYTTQISMNIWMTYVCNNVIYIANKDKAILYGQVNCINLCVDFAMHSTNMLIILRILLNVDSSMYYTKC